MTGFVLHAEFTFPESELSLDSVMSEQRATDILDLKLIVVRSRLFLLNRDEIRKIRDQEVWRRTTEDVYESPVSRYCGPPLSTQTDSREQLVTTACPWVDKGTRHLRPQSWRACSESRLASLWPAEEAHLRLLHNNSISFASAMISRLIEVSPRPRTRCGVV